MPAATTSDKEIMTRAHVMQRPFLR
jgi:hypothetical protein